MNNDNLDVMLNQVGVSIQLKLSKYKELLESYEALVKYISNNHVLSTDDGIIFVQGSFAIDTAIKPLKQEDVDVDVVTMFSQVWQPGMQVTPFYDKLEDVFKDSRYRDIYELYKNVIRINYASNYHFDIMPTLPIKDENSNELKATDTKKGKWVDRFPKLYIDWYVSRANLSIDYKTGQLYDEKRYGYTIFRDMAYDTLKKPENYYNKPQLTRAIQLIKRARDIFFRDIEDNIPQSIVLTTMIAKAYEGEKSIYKSLENAALLLYDFAKSGKQFDVENPVSNQEKFTDKWKETPEYYYNFRRFAYWLLYMVRCINTENRKHAFYYIEKVFGSTAREKIMTDSFSAKYRQNYLSNSPDKYSNDEKIESKFQVDLQNYVELDCTVIRTEYSKFFLRNNNTKLVIGDSLKFFVLKTVK